MLICDVQPFLTVQRHRHRQHELTITRTIAFSKFAQVFFIKTHDADAYQRGARGVCPIQDENAAILAHHQIVRIDKAPAQLHGHNANRFHII